MSDYHESNYPVGYPVKITKDDIIVSETWTWGSPIRYIAEIEIDGEKDSLPCTIDNRTSVYIAAFHIKPGTKVREKLDKIHKTKCRTGSYKLTLKDNKGTVYADGESIEFFLPKKGPSRQGDWIFDQVIWPPDSGRPIRTEVEFDDDSRVEIV